VANLTFLTVFGFKTPKAVFF